MEPFCLNDYDCIAFDMDHTFVQYDLEELAKLIYRCLVSYLRKQTNPSYDPCILDLGNFDKYRDFMSKGLIFDYVKGNFIKISKSGYVLSCSHGLSQLSNSEIEEEYGVNRLWSSFSALKNGLPNAKGYATVENYYVTPAIPLISVIVDHLDSKNKQRQQNYFFLWKDVVHALDFHFSYTDFKARKGLFFPSLIDDPGRYVKKCSESVLNWIEKIQETKTTVLITHSFGNFTDHIMTFTVGADWKSKFHFILSHAQKPRFFHEVCKDQPVYRMDDNEEISGWEIKKLELHTLYLCGSSRRLEREIQQYLGKDSTPKFVYFGDSLKSDIYSPSIHTDWHTVVIFEELEGEEELYHLNKRDESEPKTKKRKSLLKEGKLITASNRWGSLFTHEITDSHNGKGDEQNNGVEQKLNVSSKLNTFWADVAQTHSKLAIPLLDYIAELPLDHKFVALSGSNVAFYPCPPRLLME